MAENIRVLLVDDSSLVRDLLVKALSAPTTGLEIVGAAIHGQDALDKLRVTLVDVVVTDMEMPVMNGLEFIRRAMASAPLPIIVLSSWAHSDKSITLQALEAGAADFIPKPSALSPQGFQETLARLIVKIKAAARIVPRYSGEPNARAASAQRMNPLTSLNSPYRSQGVSQGVSQTAFSSVAVPSVAVPALTIPTAIVSTVFAPMAQPLDYEQRIGQLIIGVGEFAASNEYGKIIKTFALGSCVALNLFSPMLDVVGMAHIALASSTTSPDKAQVLPGYFADTALPALINEMRSKGYRKPVSHLVAKIAGGAQTSADANNYFKIGEKNVAAIKALLQGLGIALLSEDIGDSFSRTVFIQAGSKAVNIASPERKSWIV
jgi:chemotaxis protein CheD